MNRLEVLRRWKKEAQQRLQEAKAQAAQAERFGQPDTARSWLDQHAAPAQYDLDLIDQRLREMGLNPDDLD